MNSSFYQIEDNCQRLFKSFGTVFHCVSPENYEIIFVNEKDFKDGLLIFAICCKLHPSIRVFTVEFMNNHFHIIIAGDKSEVLELLDLFKSRLIKYFNNSSRFVNLNKLSFTLHPIDTLEYFRSSIAYCNRNGFVANKDYTPFSYPWGANTCYYNPSMKHYYKECRKLLTKTDLRATFHSKIADEANGLYMLNNCVCPLSFCDIESGERVFRDAKHYFYCVSRNIESYGKISSILCESIALTDEDLFYISTNLSKELFGQNKISMLSLNSRVELAKKLHYDYNAGVKQLQRILKLPGNVLDSMF